MSKHILIIDDSLTVRMYHRQILEKESYSVDEAENGMEALEKIVFNNYDLFIVDINMPVLDGYSFVNRLRKEHQNDTPVIMISTEAKSKDKEISYENGASFYMIKPVKPESLQIAAKILTYENEER